MLKRLIVSMLAGVAMLGLATPAGAVTWDWGVLTVSNGGDRGYGYGEVRLTRSGPNHYLRGTGFLRKESPGGGDSIYWQLNWRVRGPAGVPVFSYQAQSQRTNDFRSNPWPINRNYTPGSAYHQALFNVKVCIDRRFAIDPCSVTESTAWRNI
jgi:hypothetical protein